jgi:hypothetical protein
LFALQTVFYIAGGIAIGTRTSNKLLKVPGTLCLLNAAALVALISFLRRSGDVGNVWQPTSVVTSAEPLSREARK